MYNIDKNTSTSPLGLILFPFFSLPFFSLPLFTALSFLLLAMGINTSTLSPESQPGSALQTCLTGAFADASLVTFPQAVDYTAQIHAYNLDYPVYPAAIVRPKTTEEVSAAVQCAVKAGVKVQPRSGGHSFANYCLGGTDGALVVDLINLQKFEMDRTTWRATVGGGTLLGDITKRMHNAGGRAIAHGTCPQVGIGGMYYVLCCLL